MSRKTSEVLIKKEKKRKKLGGKHTRRKKTKTQPSRDHASDSNEPSSL